MIARGAGKENKSHLVTPGYNFADGVSRKDSSKILPYLIIVVETAFETQYV